VLNSCDDIKNNTLVSSLSGKFANIEEVKDVSTLTISEMFSKIKEEVSAYYA